MCLTIRASLFESMSPDRKERMKCLSHKIYIRSVCRKEKVKTKIEDMNCKTPIRLTGGDSETRKLRRTRLSVCVFNTFGYFFVYSLPFSYNLYYLLYRLDTGTQPIVVSIHLF